MSFKITKTIHHCKECPFNEEYWDDESLDYCSHNQGLFVFRTPISGFPIKCPKINKKLL